MAREGRARAGEPESPGWGEAVPHNGPVIDHVDIRVADRDASQRFYESVLTVLGRTEPLIDSEYIDWGDFSIVSDGQPVAKHLQIAFSAPSPELVRTGLRDPDGNSVEVVYTAQERKPGAIDHVTLRTRDVMAIRRFYVARTTSSASTRRTTSRSAPSRTSPASRRPSTSTSRSPPTRTRRSTPSTAPRSPRPTRQRRAR